MEYPLCRGIFLGGVGNCAEVESQPVNPKHYAVLAETPRFTGIGESADISRSTPMRVSIKYA